MPHRRLARNSQATPLQLTSSTSAGITPASPMGSFIGSRPRHGGSASGGQQRRVLVAPQSDGPLTLDHPCQPVTAAVDDAYPAQPPPPGRQNGAQEQRQPCPLSGSSRMRSAPLVRHQSLSTCPMCARDALGSDGMPLSLPCLILQSTRQRRRSSLVHAAERVNRQATDAVDQTPGIHLL